LFSAAAVNATKICPVAIQAPLIIPCKCHWHIADCHGIGNRFVPSEKGKAEENMRRSLLLLMLLIASLMANPGDTLRIAYTPSPPFIMGEQGEDLHGISIWLWKKVASELGRPFKVEKMPLEDMLRALKEKRIDISLNPLTVTAAREADFDFSMPFFVSNSTVVAKQRSTLTRSIDFIASFFSYNFLRAIFALLLVLMIFGILVWLFERRRNDSEFPPGAHGLWHGLWWSAVTMTTVGYGDKSPQTIGGRIVALIWMFTAIIIISGFTASIASSLTINQLSWSGSELIDYKEMRIGTVQASATEHWLRQNFFRDVHTFAKVEAGLAAVNDETIDVFVYDEPILRYLQKQSEAFAGLEVLPIQFNLQLYAFAFSSALPDDYIDRVSQHLLKYTESSDWDILLSEYDLSRR
jgi:polar amino acid transport system substrate-binding protein